MKKKQIIIRPNTAKERARELRANGGEVSDIEVLRELATLLKEEMAIGPVEDIEFVRDGEVQDWGVRSFWCAMVQGVEVR